MTIDPKTLPEDAVVAFTCRHMSREQVGTRAAICPDHEVIRVFVPVPDGMTVEDAQQALTEHVAWVPLPDGPAQEHVGKRARCLVTNGPTLLGVIEAVNNMGLYNSIHLRGGWGAENTSGKWFIHPDDVPTDPDAELIEAMAKAGLNDTGGNWDGLIEQYKDQRRQEARAALAVVRKRDEATR